jgi:hypothetical protein
LGLAIIMVLLASVAAALLKPDRNRRRPRKRPISYEQVHSTANTNPPSKLDIELAKTYSRQPQRLDVGKARFELKRPTILTAREIECYHRLVASLSPHFLVFPQVAFSQILEARGGSHKQNQWLFRTMSQKVADFLICKADLTMVAIIELDDSSHYGKEEKDRQRYAVIRQIGLLPLRLPRTPPQEALNRYAKVLSRMFPPTTDPATKPKQALYV